MNMPEADGIELADMIRRDPTIPMPGLVMLTSTFGQRQAARRLIDEILCGVQRRGGTPDEFALELKLALEHLLEQFGLVLQRSHQIARRCGRAGSQRGGDRAEIADRVPPRLQRDQPSSATPVITSGRARTQNKFSGSRRRGDTREQVGGKPRLSALRGYSRRVLAGPAGRLRPR